MVYDPDMTRALGLVLPVCFVAVAVALAPVLQGCAVKASASAKANTGGDLDAEGSVGSGGASTAPPRTAPPPPPAETSAPATPAPAGCAFRCYIADGPHRLPLLADDETRITQTFAPTIEAFRVCTGGRGFHRKGSPTVNLRFNFQGELADEGHDLTDYYDDPAHACYEAVPKLIPKLAGPPASAVRCTESCVTKKSEKAAKAPGKKAPGGKGPRPPASPPPQDVPPPADAQEP